MTIHAVILPDPVALATRIIDNLDVPDAGGTLKILVDAQPHVTTTDRDGAIALAKEHGARVILIDGKRLQVVTSHDLVAEGETAGAPAKAPEPVAEKAPRKKRTKAEIDRDLQALRVTFDNAARLAKSVADLANPRERRSPEGKAWDGWVRAWDEARRANEAGAAAVK